MILDGLLQFSTNQALTVTAASTNVIDLSVPRDLGIGDNKALKIFCAVAAAFVGLTNLMAQIQGSQDNSTWYTMVEGPVVPQVNLTVGTRLLNIDLPRPADPYQPLPRYLRTNYVITGTATAGAVNAYIVLDRQDQVYYPPGIQVFN